MGQSFTQKLIELDIALANDPQTNQALSFSNGSNSVTISNSRVSARVQHAGLPKGSTAHIEVWGLTPTLMNELSTLGLVFNLIPQNTLSIRAGDAVSGLSTVFIGTIRSAVPDFNRAPEVPMVFECFAGEINQVTPTAAGSYPQATDVATIMSALASRMGYGFENNGVNVKLPPSYFPGTPMDQVKKVAQDANIVAELVPGSIGQLVLAIWPKGGSRNTPTPPLLSPSTGMIGYPSYSQIGLTVRTLFNPQISLGGLVQIQSSLPKATGSWVVLDLNHNLDSLVPSGQWESILTCFNPNYAKFGVPSVV